MNDNHCPHCGKPVNELADASFCPFCGGRLKTAEPERVSESAIVRDILEQVKKTEDPRKKHALLLEAEQQDPQSLAVAQELLFLGRLHMRGGKHLDFSIIKCYLFMLYLQPEQLSRTRQEELREELFAHPQLLKCLELCVNKDDFMRSYLLKLAGEFIFLFLRGDSRYMRRLFGFGLESRASKNLADPVAVMLNHMQRDEQLKPEQRNMLMSALYQAFDKDMGGDTKWLDDRLKGMGMVVPGSVL